VDGFERSPTAVAARDTWTYMVKFKQEIEMSASMENPRSLELQRNAADQQVD
jgi:hypothetical protein